ncbi:MAG: terminase [Gammaproteobacteria bacterium]|nr:terminase [Gammaproteobacteria bacterium]
MSATARTPALPLYGYQQRWLADKSRFKVGMFARQTGKTFTTTLEVSDHAFEHVARGQRTRWVILSRGERQAKEAMNEGIKRHCQAYNMAIKAIEYDWRGDEGSYKALEVELPHGTVITALPANPDTARGFSSNVFLDEFGIHKDSRAIWGALFPVISKKGLLLRVTSTPNGKGNKFYEIMTSEDSIWSRHTVDIYQAVKDGLPRDIDELRRGLNDDDLWAQEYELQWLDEASAWLSYDLINSVEDGAAGNPDGYQGNPCYIGNDIAARNDLWVAWVWELVGDVLWTREIRVLRRAKFAEHDAVMDELFETYNVSRLVMDQTGMGEKPVEDAKKRYGEHRVEGIQFSGASKQLLASYGKQAFEDRKVRIPLGDTELRADLHKLRKIVTPLGHVRFDADSDSTGHADRTWAAFMGIYAGTQFAQPPAGASVESNHAAYTPNNFKHRRSLAMRQRRAAQ